MLQGGISTWASLDSLWPPARGRRNFFNHTIQLPWATQQPQILQQGQFCFGYAFPSPPDANFKPNPAVSKSCLPSVVIFSWCWEDQRLLLLEEMQSNFYYHNASGNSDWALTVNTGTKGQRFLNAVYHLTTVFHFDLAIQTKPLESSNRKYFCSISRQSFQ